MHAKTAGRLIGFTWLTVAFVFANTTGPLAVTPASAVDAPRATPQVPQYSEDAAAKAQKYLDRFYRFALSDGVLGRPYPTVHVAWNGHQVHVAPVAMTAEGYSGRFRTASDHGSEGQVIEFKKENVIDWEFYGPNRKTFGDFQTRAKVPSMSEGQAMRARGSLSASPVPAGW